MQRAIKNFIYALKRAIQKADSKIQSAEQKDTVKIAETSFENKINTYKNELTTFCSALSAFMEAPEYTEFVLQEHRFLQKDYLRWNEVVDKATLAFKCSLCFDTTTTQNLFDKCQKEASKGLKLINQLLHQITTRYCILALNDLFLLCFEKRAKSIDRTKKRLIDEPMLTKDFINILTLFGSWDNQYNAFAWLKKSNLSKLLTQLWEHSPILQKAYTNMITALPKIHPETFKDEILKISRPVATELGFMLVRLSNEFYGKHVIS
jgi:hypothetical protein